MAGVRAPFPVRMAIAGFAMAGAVGLCPPGPAWAQDSASPPFLLVGVIMSETGESMAILEDALTHEQELHPLDAQIGGVRLTRILRDRVVLTSEGVAVEVRLAGSPPQPRTRPIPRRIPPSRFGRTTSTSSVSKTPNGTTISFFATISAPARASIVTEPSLRS